MTPITPLLNDKEIVKLYQSRSESAIRMCPPIPA